MKRTIDSKAEVAAGGARRQDASAPRTVAGLLAILLLLSSQPAGAQASATDLSLKQAIALALQKNPGVRAASAAEAESAARLLQARSGYLPRVNYAESFQRSNNPVYVFGTLLEQHQFGPGNFAINQLNFPSPVNNFQSVLSFDQVVFDGRQTSLNSKAAHFGEQVAREGTRRTNQEVIEAVVEAYYGAVLAAESVRVAGEARKSAEESLKRAQTLFESGMTTEGDVLSLRVHLAAVREEQIRANNSLQVAKATLNNAMGVPLDTEYRLTSPLTQAAPPADELTKHEGEAMESRPEARQALLATQIAGVQTQLARSSFLPQVIFHGGVESDRGTFATRIGNNWMAALSLRFNILNGGADRARLAETAAASRRTDAERERAHSGIRLEVRRAFLDVRAAAQRIEVARAALSEAEESLRILQTRYAAGLANVTDLLRTETALLAARTRQLAAVYDQRLAAVRLERAVGRLTPESEALNP